MSQHESSPAAHDADLGAGWCDIVGRGRMGHALADALGAAGVRVRGPLGRGALAEDATIVLLCVPDREIAGASALVPLGAVVGHVSASASLDELAPHERFSMHPLLSVIGVGAEFTGATCAVDASTPRALAIARSLAERLGMRARAVTAEHRALYHAAASMASNYFVTLEWAAERLAVVAGVDRAALVPLVRSSLAQWAERGAREALTGPIVRGDDATVARQRDAVALAVPELLPLWDALAEETRRLAGTT
ncbi:MAG: DUF2520 domain-containing protein [Gemmatimonadaceae bacterium]